MISMNEHKLLAAISDAYQSILGSKLTGIYVHGSLAFGCFRWDVSDIDFLVVVREPLTLSQKEALIAKLLELDDYAPPKGLEMSVVLEQVCTSFRYPTPFELHFSNAHKSRCRENLAEYCRTMNGTDPDLAAHITVIHRVGYALYGKPIPEVFGPVPKEAYLDSILGDIADASEAITQQPVYCILNLCRVLAYLEEGLVLSKEQGGYWGISHLPEHAALIRSALDTYTQSTDLPAEPPKLEAFAVSMLRKIKTHTGENLC